MNLLRDKNLLVLLLNGGVLVFGFCLRGEAAEGFLTRPDLSVGSYVWY